MFDSVNFLGNIAFACFQRRRKQLLSVFLQGMCAF